VCLPGFTTLLSAGEPDSKWDNHHWSNHEDWIAAQGDGGRKEAYVFHLPSNTGYRVTFEGKVGCPDVWIKNPSTRLRAQ